MDRAHRYTFCGLAIASDVAIPGLSSVLPSGPFDLQIAVSQAPRSGDGFTDERLRYMSPERDHHGTPQLIVWTRASGAHRLRYHDGTEFVIDALANHIEVQWESPLTEADTAVYLLGPVLGFVIRLRGIIPLHASAVLIGTEAVAFLGDAWAGKSTTAAAFAALGYPVLADDLLPVVTTSETTLACPSHPRLTIWPDSARALFADSAELPRLTPTYDKRYIDLQGAERFQRTPVPLRAIYVLGHRTGTDPFMRLETMPPPAALLSLVCNTYGNYLLDTSMRALEFDVLSRIARQIPVRRLSFAEDMSQLPAACRRLAEETLMEAK
jgi:hypothetical protein